MGLVGDQLPPRHGSEQLAEACHVPGARQIEPAEPSRRKVPRGEVAHELAGGTGKDRPVGLAADLQGARVVLALEGGFEQEGRPGRVRLVILEEAAVDDVVRVRVAEGEPGVVAGTPRRAYTRGAREPSSGGAILLEDAGCHGSDMVDRVARAAVAGHHPDEVVDAAVAAADIAAVLTAALDTV